MRYNGSRVGKVVSIAASAASGIFASVDVLYNKLQSKWPSPTTAPNITGVNAVNSSTLSVTWSNTNTVFQIYVINNANGSIVATANAGATSISIGGLSANTTYTFKVAYNVGGTYAPFTSGTASGTTCLAYGTDLGQQCNGYTLQEVFANGSCGTYTVDEAYNSAVCGYGEIQLYISEHSDGDSYICVDGPCGHQEDDDSAGNLQSCVGCTTTGGCFDVHGGACCGCVGGVNLWAGSDCNSADIWGCGVGDTCDRCPGGNDCGFCV